MKYFLSQCLLAGMMCIAIGSLAEDKPPIINIKFDEGSGEKVSLGKSTKQTGILTGKYKWVKGQKGNAVKFSPLSYVTIPYVTSVYRSQKKGLMTIDGWIFRDTAKDFGFIIRQEGCFSLLVVKWDPRRLNFAVWDKDKKYHSFDTEPCLLAGKWQHFGVTVDHKMVKIFIDGKMILNKPLKQKINASRADIYIGAGFDGFDKKLLAAFTGTLDCLRIFDTVKPDSFFTKTESK